MGVRPGWIRLNFNYFLSEKTFEFILKAVDLVANYGWRLIPDYKFCSATGNWVHRKGRAKPAMRLHDISYASGTPTYESHHSQAGEETLDDCLRDAEAILQAGASEEHLAADHNGVYGPGFETLRWFPLPHEVVRRLKGEVEAPTISHPLRLRCADRERNIVPPAPRTLS